MGGAILVGIILYIFLPKIGITINPMYLLPLFFTTLLPDILEPANHYNHRKFFHSKKVLNYLLIGLVISFIISLMLNGFFYVFFGILGYVVHLLMDSTTKIGLPQK